MYLFLVLRFWVLLPMANFKNSTTYISIGIALLLMLSLYFIIDPSSTRLFPKCPFLSLTGLYCPGCGSQRAIHNLLNGNIIIGIRHNYLLILVFVVLCYQLILFIANSYFEKSFKNLFHKSSISKTILILVLAFWILRNLSVFPFTELAP